MVLKGNGVSRCALENEQLTNIFSHFRYHLDPTGTGTHNTHSLATEIDFFLGPATGHILLASIAFQTFKVRLHWRRDQTRCHDTKLRRDHFTGISCHAPSLGIFIKYRRHYASFKGNIVAHIVAIRDMISVLQQLWLGGVALSPIPLIL